jgi:hypothetical protein
LYSSGVGGSPTLLADGGDTSFRFAAASADTETVVFETASALLPADVRASGRQAYAVISGGLQLAGVDAADEPLSACGAAVGAGTHNPPNAVSRDGRRIFIKSPDGSGCGVSRLYLREAQGDGWTTTEISASRCARVDCGAPQAVAFAGATPSGSVAYMTTRQQLTDDDVDDGLDLYRYEVATGTLSRVSVGPPGVLADVGLEAHPSEDGSHVYFGARGQLIPGVGGASGSMYLADGDGLQLVAPSRFADDEQVTPDGRRLLFTSTAKLTPDDTDTQGDVFLYDADDDTLTRVSGAPGGNGALAARTTQELNPRALDGYPLRSISDDGRHVFFVTDEALVADDGNATADVYEWHDGDLGLVTSGAATSGSVRYRQASADGSSVFFTTDESLVPADDDRGDPDLYVARTDGGFPEPLAEPPAPTCVGLPCAAPPPAPRVGRPIPASVDFVAPPQRRSRPLRVLPISRSARRRMAALGRVVLRVRTAASGRIAARARARVGRRARTVARGRARADRAGTVRLRLRLSRSARRRLSRGRNLRLRIVVRRFDPNRSSVMRLTLRRPR